MNLSALIPELGALHSGSYLLHVIIFAEIVKNPVVLDAFFFRQVSLLH